MTYSIKTRLKAAALGASALVALTGAAQADQVINDDLIVTGSLCVGFDCVNGESFGFDTIRMKENNTRIKFQDTSNSASFPTNDWQLTANDSTNGGANKFSIDDIDNGRTPFTIIAAARSNAIFVNSNGNVGFGTATPAVTLHARSGNTPTLRLEQDGSSGFAPQTWDVAGNETNFFIRDATNGSQLPLRIRPSAPSNSIFVQNNGDVGMGTASPAESLHVRRTDGSTKMLIEEASGTEALRDMTEWRNNGRIELLLNNTGAGAAVAVWKISHAGDDFRILNQDTAGSQEFSLDPDGNLSILGNLTVNTGGTSSTFPDYVFEEGYELMPLSEVERFIALNGHLPKVPSAAHVGEHGINVSELQITLLKKVEELTLYALEQEKRITALQARLDVTPAE